MAGRKDRQKAPQEARRAADRLWPWAFGAMVVLGVAVVAHAIRSRPPYPRAGAHWHAPFTVEVCGRALAFPPSPGNVHTHGDGVIHVHPETDEEGRQATLATFFRSIGVSLEPDTLVLPDGRRFRNGDRCGDRPGRLRVWVNDREMSVEEFLRYYPQDRDRVRVRFG
ncbi:MAG: hypothetical protein RMM30_01370 [Armatimonadota bacterium]|nr:hypothetical protein [Armatimonadota bacterium]MDW8155224.1 hypothetical protein [Armatimonadota bacterium]